jgi:hypothetical protein
MFSASFKHGITTETRTESVRSASPGRIDVVCSNVLVIRRWPVGGCPASTPAPLYREHAAHGEVARFERGS